MYRSPEARLRDDRGFTLIEVVVALGLFLLVTAAVLPQVIVGLRAAGTARDVTQAKGVAQAQVERMRNMPFYVGFGAGPFRDVLDTYYPSRAPGAIPVCGNGASAFPQKEWSGYVTGTRCGYEPSGPFYRKVINPVQAPGLGVFSMVVDTQFMTSTSTPTPVAAQATYTSNPSAVSDTDSPPAMQLAVTVTVFYDGQRGDRYTSVYSQIDRVTPAAPLIVAEAEVSTVKISSASAPTTTLSMDTGVVNLSGELFAGSRTSSVANAGIAANSLGAQASAASTNAVAPPDTSFGTVSAVSTSLGGGLCLLVCFGNSQTSGVSAIASNGLPQAGTPTAPIQAVFPQGASNNGFSFSNTATPASKLQLDPLKPMVSLDGGLPDNRVQGCAFISSSDPAVLRATGYVNTTKGTTSMVDACATAQSSTIRLFPTLLAPDGIVRINLVQARTRCTVSTTGTTTTPTVSADFTVTVSYRKPSGYSTPVTFTELTPTGAGLVSIPLTSPVIGGLTLGDYISSWRSLTATDVVKTPAAKEISAALQGVVSIDTVPTRGSDPTSVISLEVGSLSCKAGDYR